MMPLEGHCLCGAVRFSISGPLPKLYQCHCSECRRATGSSCNSSLLIAEPHLNWLEGKALVSHYQADSGYNVHFCALCASPVPNLLSQGHYYWVPAGALQTGTALEVAAHLCVASMAKWDTIADGAKQYADVPAFSELLQQLAASEAER